MCFPKKKKKHEKKSSTKAAQKQQQQQKRATTKTMNFQTSTQKKSWMFSSPEHLARRRREQRKKTLIALLRGRNPEEKEEKEGEEETLLEKEFSFPSAKDEEIYRKRLEAKIESLCSAFNLPVKVTVSATTLFKRYCLANPIMLTNLKIVMVASVYVACKVEESYVSAEQLCKVVKDIDYNKVLNAELAVLQGVDFQLISFGAFRPLRGFRADAIHSVSSSNNNEGGGDASSNSKELVVEKIRECYNKSQEDLKKQLLTDAMFLFPPGQLALSAFLKAAREMGCNELEEYIVTKCLRNEPDLLKNLSIIENMAKEQGEEPKDTEAKKADQAMKAFQKKNAKTLSAALKKQASKENLGGEDEEEDDETRKQKKQKLVDEERAKEDAAFD